MRGLRSTLVLVVLLAGLVGYIYYLNGREPTSTDTKEKAFAAVKGEDVEDIRIKAADGQTTRVQKADGRIPNDCGRGCCAPRRVRPTVRPAPARAHRVGGPIPPGVAMVDARGAAWRR